MSQSEVRTGTGYAGYASHPAPPRGRQRSRFAIASLVLGLLWFYGAASVVAVVLGVFGLRDTRAGSGRTGRWMAVVGLVLGCIGVAVTVQRGITLFDLRRGEIPIEQRRVNP
jgi:hypothetical protein